MRLTSITPGFLSLVTASLFTLVCLPACPGPPSSEEGTSNGTSSGDGDGDGDGDTGPVIICTPGETMCLDEQTLLICAPTGLDWDEVPCEGYDECDNDFNPDPESEDPGVATCVGPCERLADQPSSEGCSFYTTSMYQESLPPGEEDPPDAIIVGNPQDQDATVELRLVPLNTNIEQLDENGGPVVIPPGGIHVFELDPALTLYTNDGAAPSLFRSGSVYHVVSDLPVVAYLHAPYEEQNVNGSTLLLPENVLQNDYIIYNYGTRQVPNYFLVIAMENQTTVTWRPTVATAGDALPLPFIEANGMGSQLMNRFDNLRIDTSRLVQKGGMEETPRCEQDLSGTIIEADKPIWVVSAVKGLRLPWCGSAEVDGCTDDPSIPDGSICDGGSDFAMEQNLPLEYWGREYVGPHAPLRGGGDGEKHYWRVFAGEDDVTVTVTPPQPGTPLELSERGEWVELVVDAGTNLEFDGDGVFMPIQYVGGHYVTDYIDQDDKKIGSPAMVQMVPTAQFLDRYVFLTGVGYSHQYVQVIRESGAGDIVLDDQVVTGWEDVGDWQVATVGPGLEELVTHEIHAEDPNDSFGIIQYGYSPHTNNLVNSSGYGYMGGIKAEVIFIP